MVKNKLYISLIIILVSTILGMDLLLKEDNKPTSIAYATEEEASLVMDDFIEEVTTTTTTTSTTTTTTTIPVTTTMRIATTQKVYSNNLSISGYNKYYPLVKASNTSYEELVKGNKYAVLDYRLDFNKYKKVIIYGHSFVDGGGLFNYFQNYDGNKSFYDNHKYITVNYNGNTYRYEIFSVYIVTANKDDDPSMEYYYWYNYNDVKWDEVIKSYKNKSQYNTGVDVSGDDEILIIQTCSTNPSVAGKYYKANLLIMGKLIR